MREPLFVGLVVVDATRLADERAELRLSPEEGVSPIWTTLQNKPGRSLRAKPVPPSPAAKRIGMSVFNTKDALQSAVAEWMTDAANATGAHGHISAWDTSRVTDMSYLLCGVSSGHRHDVSGGCNVRNRQFNDDINGWDVSQVTSMDSMFWSATSFNRQLNSWDVSQVANMEEMFRETSFDQRLDSWNVSQVTLMTLMFDWASQFDQQLSSWDVSQVTSMNGVFVVHSAPPLASRLSPLRTAHTALSPPRPADAAAARASATIAAVRPAGPLVPSTHCRPRSLPT